MNNNNNNNWNCRTDWVVVALSMTGRFFVCIAFSTIYIYGAELFPTVIRGSAMGVGVTFSRTGAIISPYLADMVSSLSQGFNCSLHKRHRANEVNVW